MRNTDEESLMAGYPMDMLSKHVEYTRIVKTNRLYMKTVYAICATQLWCGKSIPPHSHTTIRCMCNDIMDNWKKLGFAVCEWYSQDKAYREVTKLIKQLDDNREELLEVGANTLSDKENDNI